MSSHLNLLNYTHKLCIQSRRRGGLSLKLVGTDYRMFVSLSLPLLVFHRSPQLQTPFRFLTTVHTQTLHYGQTPASNTSTQTYHFLRLLTTMGCGNSKVVVGKREAANYYGTIGSRPKLIARSDYETRRWSKMPSERRQATNHRLITFWHDPSCQLYNQILDVIPDLWVARIDILRVGPRGCPKPVKLVITIWPYTLEKHLAWHLTIGCRAVLRKFGVWDVEVEILEDAWAESRRVAKRVEVDEKTGGR